jgi:hypothetical protein
VVPSPNCPPHKGHGPHSSIVSLYALALQPSSWDRVEIRGPPSSTTGAGRLTHLHAHAHVGGCPLWMRCVPVRVIRPHLSRNAVPPGFSYGPRPVWTTHSAIAGPMDCGPPGCPRRAAFQGRLRPGATASAFGCVVKKAAWEHKAHERGGESGATARYSPTAPYCTGACAVAFATNRHALPHQNTTETTALTSTAAQRGFGMHKSTVPRLAVPST